MPGISVSGGGFHMTSNVIVSSAGLDRLAKKGVDVEAAFTKLAFDTAGKAAQNIRTVGAIDTSYMVNTTAARPLETAGPVRSWSIGTAAFYGVFIEYGTRYMGARPWLTPAMAWARQQVDALLRAALRV